jgi:hypothetical protein
MRSFIFAIVAVTALSTGKQAFAERGCKCVQCRQAEYGNPDLFASYFVDPNCGGVGVSMYPAPGPVPAHVGLTYYTYQPLMPHEMLYKHKRTYHRYYNEGRGLTRTSVRWR